MSDKGPALLRDWWIFFVILAVYAFVGGMIAEAATADDPSAEFCRTAFAVASTRADTVLIAGRHPACAATFFPR